MSNERPKKSAEPTIRGSLKELLDVQEIAQLLEEHLREGLKAVKPRSVPCPACGHSVTVELADLATRVTAATKLLESLEGRLKEAQSDADAEHDREVQELLGNLRELSDEELGSLYLRLND